MTLCIPSHYVHLMLGMNFILQHDLDLNITCVSPLREESRVIALILSLHLSLYFYFSFHFFFHNLQIRLLMAYAAAIKVTHTARGSVCHQNSRLENKCAHTRDSTHLLEHVQSIRKALHSLIYMILLRESIMREEKIKKNYIL